jgi:peptidoglycan/LPS O-acetylase OafA/YrhL
VSNLKEQSLSKLGRENNFDLLRLLAAIQVMFCHATEHLHIPVSDSLVSIIDSFPGVPIFFCISGFLIAKSYLENKGDLRKYSINRFLRIYPGLWVNMIFLIIILFFTNAIHIDTLKNFIQFVLYQVVLFTTGSDFYANFWVGAPYDWNHFYKYMPSGVWWTITVELGFYLLVPFIYMNAVHNERKKFFVIMITCTLISLGFASINSQLHTNSSTNSYGSLMTIILPYLWIFLFSGSIFIGWQRTSWLFEGKIVYWLTSYLLFTCYFHKGSSDFQTLNTINVIRVLFMSCTILSFAYSIKNISKILKHTDLSYGIYLWHMPVIVTINNLGVLKENSFLLVVVFLLTSFFATISWFLIEKPAMKLKHRLYYGAHESINTLNRSKLNTPITTS